jgi:hypothetical protein
MVLPNFQNAFEWSVPFIGQCLQHFCKHLVKLDKARMTPKL